MSYKKYYVYKQQYSEDGGRTWNDTNPLVTSPSGDPIGEYETLVQCQGLTPDPQYRDVSGATSCVNYDKYVRVEHQVSKDGGSTWQTTATTQDLVERNSPDCGYEPPTDPCTCSNLNIFSNTFNVGAEGGTVNVGSITNGCTFSASSLDWADAFQSTINVGVGVGVNTSTEPRTGNMTFSVEGNECRTITLVQAGKSLECSVATFTLQTEVCKGSYLNYSYTMNDDRCTDQVLFTLTDAGGNTIQSRSTPTSGSGSGSFSIPDFSATGACSVNVNGSAYTATILDCGRTINVVITNNTEHTIQNANFWYYIGSEYKSCNFGGGMTPGSTRTVEIRITGNDYGKSWVASKVVATATSPTTKVDAEMNFNAYPSATTINDSFVGSMVSLTGFKS